MQDFLAAAVRHDRADYWRRRCELYVQLMWAACIAGGLLVLGVLARNYGWGGDFASSQLGHLLLVVLPLIALLIPAVVALTAATDKTPQRPILLRRPRSQFLTIPAAFWPAMGFERPPRALRAA